MDTHKRTPEKLVAEVVSAERLASCCHPSPRVRSQLLKLAKYEITIDQYIKSVKEHICGKIYA
ncbi:MULTISPECIES: hypothetical protein [Arcanobacterium]|uniref:Uncharacterized protein n=1 Tax=Arcanobacterium bovis TaxID=2529275 RepID=A0A4Q9V062_9ACTO|nr:MULTISPECIES: hypothetical protein [Arcanobacterium]MBM7824509.1 hypothetical protein [Arcanobacterium pluranimalium]TBW20762.1 hypothetical protein EZJ44_08235 [Arcanobacterium bovis]